MNTLAMALYMCQTLNPSPSNIEKVEIKQTSQAEAQITLKSPERNWVLTSIDYSEDLSGDDHLAVMTGEQISVVLDLNSSPIQGAINPFIDNGQNTGPIYLQCEKLETR